MRASDVMVRNVITIGPDEDVAHAARLLADHDISALPVVDENRRILGLLSEADLLRREELGTEKVRPWWLEAVTPSSLLAADYSRSHGRKVREVMSETVITARADAPLSEIAALLERKRIKRVPIVEDGKLIGIVSRANLIQALASAPEPAAPARASTDQTLRSQILDRLEKQSWTGFGERNVIVTDGIVHLWGLIGSPEERKALFALAESVPGVRGISDELIPAY
ncbi:MAG TPA: CBS domain-containing protein [Steroidobacteraceae bacterium]|nr:CBS domain-containing protein [Steroidobacteraceae bacterium]